MKEAGIKIEFDDFMEVTPTHTRARLSAEFTASTDELMDAQKAFRDRYTPSRLECHREVLTKDFNGLDIDYPILVWDAVWEHRKTKKIPTKTIYKGDEVFVHNVEESRTLVFDEEATGLFHSHRN